MGIPIVTCRCAVCKSSSKFNKRWRPSGLLTLGSRVFLIDVGPDFRDQALEFGIDHLDGLFVTHTHYDHVGGIDELRVFNILQKQRLPVLASVDTFETLKSRFYYLFMTKQSGGTRSSQFDFQLLDQDFGQVEFQGVDVEYMSYYQANMKVTGFRFGSFAYVSDIRQFDERVFESLKGVKTLVLSALRYTPSEVHFSLEEAIAFSETVGAKVTFFTHIAHELEHEKTNAKLPPGMQLAHDGLTIEFES